MKHIVIALLLTVAPFAANAGCSDIAELNTSKLHIDISDGGCGPLEITYEYKIKNDARPEYQRSKSFSFAEECVLKLNKDDQITEFSCHEKGRTPLAGATYKKMQYGFLKHDCGELGVTKVPNNKFVCVAGCTKRSVPKALDEKRTCD